MTKSPEQLEQEKREIIASRLVKLDLDRKNKQDLVKTVRKFAFDILLKHIKLFKIHLKF